MNKFKNRREVTEHVFEVDPNVDFLKSKMANLLEENKLLVQKIEDKSITNISKLLRESKTFN